MRMHTNYNINDKKIDFHILHKFIDFFFEEEAAAEDSNFMNENQNASHLMLYEWIFFLLFNNIQE